jgi:hypothetical protein
LTYSRCVVSPTFSDQKLHWIRPLWARAV